MRLKIEAVLPFFFVAVELVTLANPELWRTRVEYRWYIDFFYGAWIVYASIKIASFKWMCLFFFWSCVPDWLIHEQGSRYVVGSAGILRMDASVSIGFIVYYLWNNESFGYIGSLFSAIIYFTEKKQLRLTNIFFWLTRLVIANEISKMEKKWIKLGGDLSDFYIFQGKIMIDELNIQKIWINSSTGGTGLRVVLAPELSIVITVNGPIKAQLLQNVINGTIPIKNLMP